MKILDNVPRMMWGLDKEITFAQAAECCLRFMGYPVDYDELACASGMAFSLKWHENKPCPSAGTVEDPLYFDRMFKFVGLDYRVVPSDSPEFDEAIAASLDAERPVIVQAGFNVPDFYVLTGFDPSEPAYYGRTPFDRTDDYAKTNQRPSRAFIMGDKIEDMPEGLARLYYPLHSAVLAYNRKPFEGTWEANYKHSFEAYDEWIAQLGNPDLWPAMYENKLNLHVHTNEWVFNVLFTSRLAAGRYLLRCANFHNIKDSEHIMLAGRLYYVIAKILHQRGFTTFGTGHPEEGIAQKYLLNPDSRLLWAALLREAAEKDRMAYERITAVVGGK